MIKILKWLYILQEVSNKNRVPKLGRGFMKAYRCNPYNPLSYVFVAAFFVVALISYGVVGVFKKIKNPFKWD